MLDLFGSTLVLIMATAGVAATIDLAVHFARGGFARPTPAAGPSGRPSRDQSKLVLRPAFGAAR